MDSVQKYRITSPAIVLVAEDGRHARHVARTVPSGAIVTVNCKRQDCGARLVAVLWDDMEVMMFAKDLQARAELIN